MDDTALHEMPLHIAPDHPAFDGHFPGRPLLPGVVLLAEVIEAVLREPALAARLGATPRIASVKFTAPVTPGDALRLRIRTEDEGARTRLGFEVLLSHGPLAASGRFECGAPR